MRSLGDSVLHLAKTQQFLRAGLRLTVEHGKFFIGVTGYVIFCLFLIVSVNVLHRRIVLDPAIRLHHALGPASDSVITDLGLGQRGIQILGLLKVLVGSILDLCPEHVYHEPPRTKYERI